MTKMYCDRCGIEVPLQDQDIDEQVKEYPVGTYVPMLYVVREFCSKNGNYLSSEPCLCKNCQNEFVEITEEFMKGNG